MDKLSLWKPNIKKADGLQFPSFDCRKGFHGNLDKVLVPNNTFQTSQVKFNHHLTFNDMTVYQHNL